MKSKIKGSKKTLIALAIVPALLLIMAFKPSTTAVMFSASDWDNSKDKAMAEGKLYFVDFDASYCATCRNMDESTYMDDRLAAYMRQNVVAMRVDVQDFDGVMWSQQYEVEALPTMLIFDAEGKMVKRLVGYKSASDLIDEFNLVRAGAIPTPAPTPSAPVTSNVTPQPIAPDKPMSNPGALFQPSKSTTTSKTTPRGVTVSPNNLDDAPTPKGNGLFEVAVRKQSSQGFGVQVGVYSSYKIVLESASKFKRKYSKKTLIHIDEHNGSTVYKLLLGVFDSRREASFFRNDLRRDNTDGLVKDLRGMH